MKSFKGLCMAAAMALMVTCAFPQGRGHHDPDKDRGGGQSSGGSGRSGGSGGPSRTVGGGGHSNEGGGRSNEGGGRGYGGPSRNVGNDGGGRGYDRGGGQGRGDGRGNGGGNSGGGNSGGGSQGHGDGGRGNGNSGGGGAGGGNGGGGGSQGHGDGDIGRGRGNGNGSGSGGNSGGSGGSGNSGGGTIDRGGNRGNDNRGGGTIHVGGTIIENGGGWGSRGSGGWGSNGDGQLTHKNSHSGNVHYGENRNVASVTHIGGTIVIGRPPRMISEITKGHDIRRKDHPTLIVGGYRTGYYFYNNNWCDDYFWYPYYLFDPYGARWCASPWYYYPMLPPYVAWSRCRFYNLAAWDIWVGNSYNWTPPDYYGNYDNWGRRPSEIDYAVEDIVDAFQRGDRRAAGRLVSETGDVAIYMDGKYSYTLNSDDFYDMFLDATQNTKTKRYQILRVETGHDESNHDCVRVTARHEYEDPWGALTSVTHFYELHYEGPNLVIDKFGVSQQ
ncbi:MAG TPA: hypothetical protein VHE55_02030 [Fimbriimonadaceae bacterium]|nr:hypothetical protein [Fimbriimonadaceae bacterium]